MTYLWRFGGDAERGQWTRPDLLTQLICSNYRGIRMIT